MKLFTIHHLIEKNNPQLIQEYYRERLYGWVTISAVIITLIFSREGISPLFAFYTILSTTLGLWLAGVFASIVSARIVHNNERIKKGKVKNTFLTHRALLISGVLPLVFVTLSEFLDFLDVQTALILSLIISFLRVSFTIIDAFIKNDRHIFLNTLSFILQIITIIIIISLKNMFEK